MVECVRLVVPEGRYRSGACMPHSWTARRGLDSNSMISGTYRRNSKIRSSSSNRPTSSENASDDGKIVSKTKSRQKIEAEYYKEWERLTVVSEEELNRKMTVVTFLRFLPMWLRYNGLPGPLRYLLFHVMPWKKMQNGILGRLGSPPTSSSAGKKE